MIGWTPGELLEFLVVLFIILLDVLTGSYWGM